MLHNEDIKNLSELKPTFVSKHQNAEFFLRMIEILKIWKHHALFSGVKEKGVSALTIIAILISFPFLGQKDVYHFVKIYWNKFAGYGKAVYYRLKNNPRINWRKFLFAVVKRSISTVSGSQWSKGVGKRLRAFIFDDTTLQKTGIFIEGVSKVWNHVIQGIVLGYQLLVMGYYDGTMLLPLNFSFHRERGKNKRLKFGLKANQYRKQFKKERDRSTSGYERKRELDISKIASAVKMLKAAIKNGISADYVITDSWFTCWEIVKTSLELGLQYIGMFSRIKSRFWFKQKQYSIVIKS